MAQLSSRKTLVRAGSVAGTTIAGGYLLNEALGDSYSTAPLLPLVGTGVLAGGATAFYWPPTVGGRDHSRIAVGEPSGYVLAVRNRLRGTHLGVYRCK